MLSIIRTSGLNNDHAISSKKQEGREKNRNDLWTVSPDGARRTEGSGSWTYSFWEKTTEDRRDITLSRMCVIYKVFSFKLNTDLKNSGGACGGQKIAARHPLIGRSETHKRTHQKTDSLHRQTTASKSKGTILI